MQQVERVGEVMTFQVAKTTAPHRPNSMTHHCTAARAPQESCWQEFQPAWIHHMPSPNLSPAGKTPSSTRASVQPARLIMSCCQGLQPTTPHHPCLQELQPALDSSQKRLQACTEFKPHPRWQELSPAISSSSTRTLHPLAGQNFIQHSDSWIHHNPSNQSAPIGNIPETRENQQK